MSSMYRQEKGFVWSGRSRRIGREVAEGRKEAKKEGGDWVFRFSGIYLSLCLFGFAVSWIDCRHCLPLFFSHRLDVVLEKIRSFSSSFGTAAAAPDEMGVFPAAKPSCNY